MTRQYLLIQDRQSNNFFTLEQLDPREELKGHSESVEQTIFIPLREDDSTKTVQIGSLLDQLTKAKLQTLQETKKVWYVQIKSNN